MAIPTLAELLKTYTVPQLVDIYLAIYQAAGFPVTSWQPFGSERARLSAIASGQSIVSNQYVAPIAAGGFLNLSVSQAPDWTPLVGSEWFNEFQNPDQPAIGYMQLTNAATSNYTFAPGQLVVQFPLSTNRYACVNTISLPGNTSGANPVVAIFQSTGTGSRYNDPSNQILTLVSSYPGVGVTNPPQSNIGYHTGPSQGAITLSGALTNFASISVLITIAGSLTYAASPTFYFQYSLNGSSYSSNILGVATYTIPGSEGVVLNFADASSGNPSNFYQGDTWQFNIPGSWLIQIGTDLESLPAYANRCTLKWNTQSSTPTLGAYQRLALSTPGVGNQITQVLTRPDPNIGGKVNCIISGPDGYLSPTVVSLVDGYMKANKADTDNIIVYTPNVLAIDFQGTITISAPNGNSPVPPLSTIQTEIAEALTAYIQSIPINGTIKIAEVITIVNSQSGVLNVTTTAVAGLTQITIITGGGAGSSTVDLPLGSSTSDVKAVAAPSQASNTLFSFNYIVSN